MITNLVIQQPLWWLILAATVAVLFSVVSYFKVEYPWSKAMTFLLGFLRFSAVFFLLLLLFDPLIKQQIASNERGSIAVLWDNSVSIKETTDSLKLISLSERARELENSSQDVDFVFYDLQGTTNALNQTSIDSDLTSGLRKIQDDFEGRNLAGIALISDGIYNKGISPTFQNHVRPVFTLGLGDTIPAKDVSIRSVQVNSIAYQRNKFPVDVVVENTGFEGVPLQISVVKNGVKIGQQNVEAASIVILCDWEFVL